MKRSSVKNILTAAYLILAGIASIATSKQPDGSNQITAAYTMNYSVRSNCSSQAYDIDAMRVEQGKIAQVIRTDGIAVFDNSLDFQTFGFPNAYVMVGVNAYSADTTSPMARKCEVRTKVSSASTSYDSTLTSYQYIQPGFLTQVQYDCYDGTRYVCSTTFKELRQGDLQQVY